MVVQRSIELPSERGWGGDELVRLVTAAGGMARGLEVQVQDRESVCVCVGGLEVQVIFSRSLLLLTRSLLLLSLVTAAGGMARGLEVQVQDRERERVCERECV